MSLYLRAQLRVFVLPPMTPIRQQKGSVIRRMVFSIKIMSCKVFTYMPVHLFVTMYNAAAATKPFQKKPFSLPNWSSSKKGAIMVMLKYYWHSPFLFACL